MQHFLASKIVLATTCAISSICYTCVPATAQAVSPTPQQNQVEEFPAVEFVEQEPPPVTPDATAGTGTASQTPKPEGGTSATPTQSGESSADSTESTDSTKLVAPPITYLDLNSARFGRLEIVLKDAIFLRAHVPELKVIADNMDFNDGTLELLKIEMVDGKFMEFAIDKLNISTKGICNFETGSLLNKRVLEFLKPVTAEVTVVVSEKALNHFLNAPETLHRLSYSAKRRVPILSTLSGQDVRFGFNFTQATIKLLEENKVHLDLQSKLGMGKVGFGVPVSVDTRLELKDGWVNLADTKVRTRGQEMSADVAERIANRVNSLSQWVDRTDDIHFTFSELRVLPADRFELVGTAELRRLRFGRIQEVRSDLGRDDTQVTETENQDSKESRRRKRRRSRKH